MSLKAEVTKGKNIDTLYFKIKNLCASQNTIKKVNRQPPELETTFANGIFDKKFISRIYKNLLQLGAKKTTQLKHGLAYNPVKK